MIGKNNIFYSSKAIMKNLPQKLCLWFTGLSFSFLFLACSRGGEKIIDTTDSGSQDESSILVLKSGECVKKKCDPITMDSRIEGLSQGIFRGFVGQQLTWKIQGFDPSTEHESNSKKRRKVVVLLTNLPKNSILTPGPGSRSPLTSLATVEWTPRTPEEGFLQIVLRDFDRCEAMEPNEATCQKYNLLSAYDDRKEMVPWMIVSNSGQVASSTSDSGVKKEAGSADGVDAKSPSDSNNGN